MLPPSHRGPSAAHRTTTRSAVGASATPAGRSGTIGSERDGRQPWAPADTNVWGKLMAIRLSTDWRDELLRARIVREAGKEAIAVLLPPYPGDGR